MIDLFSMLLSQGISGDAGAEVEYESIIYNDDDSITLIEVDGTVHTAICVYEDEKLVSVTYDGEIIELVYDEGTLIKVADTQIDVSKAPVTSGESGGGGVISVCSTTTPTPSKFIEIRYFDIIGPITFPNATTIDEEAFNYCASLTVVDLPSVIGVGRYAFRNCTNLTKVDLPVATTIDEEAFDSCTSLTVVNLPTVTTIGEHAFNNCTNLTKVDLPLATSIGNSAFRDCTNLTKVDLPLATSIGNRAFRDCTSLTEVNLPSAISVGESAFNNCTSLKKVDLPSVTNIGDSAFWKCENLEAVILRTTETVCTIHTNAFAIDATAEGIPTKFNDNFYVPASMFEHYRAAYEPAFNQMGFTGYFDILFHKIEDYPEICG